MYRMNVRSAIKQQSHSSCVSVRGRPAERTATRGMNVRALVEEYFDEGGVAIGSGLYMPIVEEQLFEY
jgi:hypothetical protein